LPDALYAPSGVVADRAEDARPKGGSKHA
jgi:hypothetical protein